MTIFLNPNDGFVTAMSSNIAFERCIEVMSRLIMKYGPGLLEKMDQGKLKDLIGAEIESGTDMARFSARMLGYCKLMTDRK